MKQRRDSFEHRGGRAVRAEGTACAKTGREECACGMLEENRVHGRFREGESRGGWSRGGSQAPYVEFYSQKDGEALEDGAGE